MVYDRGLHSNEAFAAFQEVVQTTSPSAPLHELRCAYVRAALRIFDALGFPHEGERIAAQQSFDLVREEMERRYQFSFDYFCRLVAAAEHDETPR